MNAKTYRIPQDNMPNLEQKIANLAKRAKKIGMPEISMAVLRTETEEDEDGFVTLYDIVTVEGQEPRIGGFAFLGTIDHGSEVGNILRLIPSAGAVPESFRTSKNYCDHCHMNRARIQTCIMLEELTGRFLQVGFSCVKDFIGHGDPHAVAQYLELLLSACEEAEEGESFGGGSGGSRLINTERFLAFCAMSIREAGWLARSKAGPMELATADSALFFMTDKKEKVKPDAVDIDMAQNALAWGREYFEDKANLSDYEWNLRIACKPAAIDFKAIGIVASLLPYYQRIMGQEAAKRAAAEGSVSEYFGTIGKRETFKLTVTGHIDIDGQYGLTVLHKFTDAAGNIACWFASGGARINVGETVTVKATPKAHGERDGIKQTILSRVSEIAQKVTA